MISTRGEHGMREYVEIDEEKCSGCGECITDCEKDAIELRGGKAIVHNEICDHIGKCIGKCSHNAISTIQTSKKEASVCVGECCECELNFSELYNWPIKLKMAPITSRYFKNCDLLIAADCTAFAHARLHDEIMKDKVTLIVCPQEVEDTTGNRLIEILKANDIKTITAAYMHSACCEEMQHLIQECVKHSQKDVPIYFYRINIDGTIVDKEMLETSMIS